MSVYMINKEINLFFSFSRDKLCGFFVPTVRFHLFFKSLLRLLTSVKVDNTSALSSIIQYKYEDKISCCYSVLVTSLGASDSAVIGHYLNMMFYAMFFSIR